MARKRTKPLRVAAAFNPEGYAVCPLCWSRPSVAGRQRKEVESRSRGWGQSIVEKVVKHAGKTVSFASQIKYPCSNLECLGEVIVEWAGMDTGREGHAHLLNKQQLRGDDAVRYEAGHTDKLGRWHSYPRPATPEPQPKPKRVRVIPPPPAAVSVRPRSSQPIEVKKRRKAVEKEPEKAPARKRRTPEPPAKVPTRKAPKAPKPAKRTKA